MKTKSNVNGSWTKALLTWQVAETFSSINDDLCTFPMREMIDLCWRRLTTAIFSSSSTTWSSSCQILDSISFKLKKDQNNNTYIVCVCLYTAYSHGKWKLSMMSYTCLLNKLSAPQLWGIQCQRYTNFTSGYDIYGYAQILKNWKYLGERKNILPSDHDSQVTEQRWRLKFVILP